MHSPPGNSLTWLLLPFSGENNLCSPLDKSNISPYMTGKRAVVFTAVDNSFSHELSFLLAFETLHVTGSPLFV